MKNNISDNLFYSPSSFVTKYLNIFQKIIDFKMFWTFELILYIASCLIKAYPSY